MAESDPKRIGVSIDLKPHAYDPVQNPELFDGVMPRRVVAFLIDLAILSVPMVFLVIFLSVVTVVTLGLGAILFVLVTPVAVIWALAYYGLCFGSERSATIGMRMVDLEMRTWYGAPAYFVLGAVHALVFWVTVSALTPFVLLVCLFNDRRRCLHDMLVGTIVINNSTRASLLRTTGRGY